MVARDDLRLNVVNLFDGIIWRIGKVIRRLPFYDPVNSVTIVRGFCADAAAQLAAMPERVNIETINRCNGDCHFCPAKAQHDPRPFRTMSEALYRKIAAELARERYRGSIALYINNEPFIDARIARIVSVFREACPEAEILLSTNGNLLTKDRYFSVFDSGLSHLIINNYNETRRLTEKISSGLDEIRSSGHVRMRDYIRNTVILLKNKKEILNSRAGDAPNKKNMKRYKYYRRNSCSNPFRQMNILPDGRVSLCCEDFDGKMTVGNIEREDVRAVWNGPVLNKIRRELQTCGRRAIATCMHCDYGHLGGEKARSLLRLFVKWFSSAG